MGLMVYESRNFFLVCFTVLKWRHVCSHDLRTPLLFLFLCSCINRNILNLCHLLWEFEFLININFVFVLHVYNFCTRIFELKKNSECQKIHCVYGILVSMCYVVFRACNIMFNLLGDHLNSTFKNCNSFNVMASSFIFYLLKDVLHSWKLCSAQQVS